LVTAPANAVAVFVPAEEADAVGPAAAGEFEVEVEVEAGAELELELELQAAAPTTKQAPTAAMRHLEPTLIRRDIPVKRPIAPFRLSAVNSPVSGLR
jgi:hypothetical protein